jgi:hypothetical protein
VLGATGDVDPAVRPRLDAPAGVRERALGKFVVFKVQALRYFQWVGRGLKGGTSSWSFPALR